jgi:hypothetical protein
MKYKNFETESGKIVKVAIFNGYSIGDKLMEDVMFQVEVLADGTLKTSITEDCEDYFSQFNTQKWLKEADDFANKNDIFEDPISKEDCWLVEDIDVKPSIEAMTKEQIIEELQSMGGFVQIGGNPPQVIGNTSPKPAPIRVQDTTGRVPNYPVRVDIPKLSDLLNNPMQSQVEVVEEIASPPIIGKFKTKKKFIKFLSMKGGLESKIATISGSQISGIGMEDITFKITICDENTIDFEEVDTNFCNEEDIKRYITSIEEAGSKQLNNDASAVSDYVFVIEDMVRGKLTQLDAYATVEFVKPYDKLLSFLEGDGMKEYDSEVIDEKLDWLFEEEKVVEPVITEATKIYNAHIMEEFMEAKKIKRDALYKQIDTIKTALRAAKADNRLATSKMTECEREIEVIVSRIDSMGINEPDNGYFFFIPEAISEKCILDDVAANAIQKKLISIKYANIEGFFEMFSNLLYHIRIGAIVDGILVEVKDYKEIMPKLSTLVIEGTSKLGISRDNEIIYEGSVEWSHLCDKMIKLGFRNNPKFDELCLFVQPIVESNNSGCGSGGRHDHDDEYEVDEEVDDDDISEELEDFEDTYGYPMGNEFLFAVHINPKATNDICDAKVMFVITPKNHFDNEGCCYDQHLEYVLRNKFPVLRAMGDSFEELAESSFQFNDGRDYDTAMPLDLIATIEVLCRAGIKFTPRFQTFMDNCTGSSNTQLILDTMKTLGYNPIY